MRQLIWWAQVWTRFKRRQYVPMTDGTVESEQALSPVHKRLRRFTYFRSPAFIAASNGGVALYRSYGVPEERCFRPCLCVDNARFNPSWVSQPKAYDFLFCGRIEAAKSPEFALQVARQTGCLLGRKMRMLFVGSGSDEPATKALAHALSADVETDFHGFASQAALPALYQSARLFLFPTRADVCGVVANEACAAGLPVLVSTHAGVADELIINGRNGFVCELNSVLWATRAAYLLRDEKRLHTFGDRSLLLVDQYRFDLAAQGIMAACKSAIQESPALMSAS